MKATEFKVLDKVWNPEYGFGIVKSIDETIHKNILVKFHMFSVEFLLEDLVKDTSDYRSLFTLDEAALLGVEAGDVFEDENDYEIVQTKVVYQVLLRDNNNHFHVPPQVYDSLEHAKKCNDYYIVDQVFNPMTVKIQ